MLKSNIGMTNAISKILDRRNNSNKSNNFPSFDIINHNSSCLLLSIESQIVPIINFGKCNFFTGSILFGSVE